MSRTFFIFFLLIASEVKCQNLNNVIQNIWQISNTIASTVTLHPDTGLNISQFLQKYGYPLEYHDATTEDGFILTMHRIPYGKNKRIEKLMTNKTKPAMFLVHCLACSSMDFIYQGPNTSLAFLLADLGYDVWLANGRGNVHSMRHKIFTPDDPAFWDYSFHEKGYYDMPACIDYILNTTKLAQITYVGHSQGTTEGVVLTTTRPEYNKKINLMVFLSPIMYMKNLKSPPVLLLAKYFKPLQVFLNVINIHGFPYSLLFPFLTKELCNDNSFFQEFCLIIMDVIVGFDAPQVNKTMMTVYMTNTPNGISLKELYHFAQEIVSGYFRQYDYGKLGNILYYGSTSPPSYDIRKVTVPLAVYYSKNDYLAAVEDVQRFLSELPNEPVDKHLIDYEFFNHLDFVTAKDVKNLLYNRLIDLFHKHVPVL